MPIASSDSALPVNISIAATPFGKKWIPFLLINVVVAMTLLVALFLNSFAKLGNLLYLFTLSMICTLPLLFIRSYRGKQSLMLVFLAYYFAAFALEDISNLLSGKSAVRFIPDAFVTGGEIAILMGALCFIAGYGLTARGFADRGGRLFVRDWTDGSKLLLGFLFWVIGYVITLKWQFSGGDMYSGTKISNPFTGLLISFRILQPLGALVLIYHFLTSSSRTALLLLIITVIADFVLGFIGDSKELAMRDMLLYLFSLVMLRERIPILQTLVFILIAGISFSFFSAYREIVHSKHESRSDALQNIKSRLSSINGGSNTTGQRLTDGLKYFAERVSLKGSVEQILARTGSDVAFQNGHTIEPLLYVFIPRFIIPNKPNSSMAGQLFNQEFRISASRKTYIATSQVGELYWNYGWTGLIMGMAIIGVVMACVAASMRFDVIQTLPRFLFVLMTVYLLSLRSETALAEVYSVWGRAAVLLILLNAMIPKSRAMIGQLRTSPGVGHYQSVESRPRTFRLSNRSKLNVKLL